MDKWYIINTKPHSEFKVINYLISKNIKIFMPKLLVTRKHARKIEKVFRPLFPTYLFIYTNINKSYRLINSTIGVKGFLSCGDMPSTVPNNVIHELLMATDKNGLVNRIDTSNYDIGQKIEINEGIFAGNLGVFCGLSEKDRVSILLEFLGRKIKVSLSSLHISAA